MDFAASLIVVLIIAGLITLVCIVGGIIEALCTYIKHIWKRQAKEHKRNSPMANNKKGGYHYGRIHN